jgi:O-antigen ligase
MKGVLFTFLLTAVGTLGAFVDPFIALLVYVSFAIIKPDAMWHWSVPALGYSRIVAIAMLASWALNSFSQWRFGRGARPTALFCSYWVWAILSAAQSPQAALGWQFVMDMAKIVLPFVAGVTMLNSAARLRQLAWVIALSQGYVAFEMNLSYFEGFNRMQQMGFAGLDNNSAAIAMVTGFGLASFLGFFAREWWQKAAGLGSALLMAHAIMFSYSRGGMLALSVIGVFSFFLFVRQPRHLAVAAVLLLVMVRLAGPEVRTRFVTAFADEETRDRSAESRIEQWGYCWDAMQKQPLFGVGPNHWPIVSKEYGLGVSVEAHSLWLQTAAELGIPGAVCLVGMYLTVIWKLLPLAWRLPLGVTGEAREFGYLAGGVVASLVGFGVAASFVSLEGLEIAPYVAMLGAGIMKLAPAPAVARAAPVAFPNPALAVGPAWRR